MREYVDTGVFWLMANEGLRLSFQVDSGGDHCLSSCDENSITCTARLEGTRVELHSLLRIDDSPRYEVCNTACWNTTGTCVIDVPSASTYSIGFASRIDSAVVPVEADRWLFGADERGP